MVDIDHFKGVNDIHGHEAGDRTIVAVAAQIKLFGGISGRLGGEEFCLLVDQDVFCARTIAEELRKAITNIRLDLGGLAIGVTASFGVAQWDPGRDHRQLAAPRRLCAL
jgi:diguanylate cyclase (GGDEF)-like protein